MRPFTMSAGLWSWIVLFLITGCSKESADDTNTGYSIVWQDDFTGPVIDTTNWSFQNGTGKQFGLTGWGNNEKQYYTPRPENAEIVDGKLIITARQEAYEGEEGATDYTSAKLITKGKGDWQYGRFEIKAQLPEGHGTWPAIWMLPSKDNMNWPDDGEIDIMEHVGYDQNKVFGTVHTRAYNHTKGTQRSDSIMVEAASDSFHVYRIDWTPESITWYVDGQRYNTFKNEHKTMAEWPFDKPFHLILNLAVGGNWGGRKGIDPDIWPQSFVIDYVRVYQKNREIYDG